MTDPKQPPKPPAGSMLLWRKAAGDGGDGFLRVGGYDTWGPPKPELQNGLLFRRIADGSAGLLFGYTVNPGNAQAPTAEVSIDSVFAADMPARATRTAGAALAPAVRLMMRPCRSPANSPGRWTTALMKRW